MNSISTRVTSARDAVSDDHRMSRVTVKLWRSACPKSLTTRSSEALQKWLMLFVRSCSIQILPFG